MRLIGLSLLLLASAGLTGYVESLQSQPPPAKWTTGFWLWRSYSAVAQSYRETPDVLFVHAGTISYETYGGRSWHVSGELPEQLPLAGEYWFVFRYERQRVPDRSTAPEIAAALSRVQAVAQRRHLNVAGIQLDIDSPTAALPQYALFLREVRNSLPPKTQISITALLDWFRDGTAIADVIKETDEFVPQFYDVGDPDINNARGAIATKFDAPKWGPLFNRFRKRFRIGISTFGRARFIPRENPDQPRHRYVYFRDLTMLDIATDPAFNLQTTRSNANELLLNYRVTRKHRIDYKDFEPGDTVQFILSTTDGVRSAVESAQRMRGYCAGVVFFRWPGADESLALQPDEVLSAAGVAAQTQKKLPSIHLVDGACAAVNCADVYLVNATRLSPTPIRYRIRSSTELEYFLPEEKVPIRMADPSGLELSLPAYCGRGRLYLGRAVTAKRAEFTVEEEP
jgi:hypothetical protein